MDADQEIKRAKWAQSDLNMIQEFLDEERSRLFKQFAGSAPSDDLYEVHTKARALTSLEDFLLDLVNTGKMANANKEFNQ